MEISLTVTLEEKYMKRVKSHIAQPFLYEFLFSDVTYIQKAEKLMT